MDLLGPELKKAREAQGVSIRDMATRTKISVTALEALERNDVSRLPGGIFGRSFVRAYAVEVGLDPDVTVARFVDVLEKSEREAAERRRAAQPEITLDDRQFLERQQRALMALRIGIVVAVLAVIALVVWQVRAAWPLFNSAASTSAAATTADGSPDTSTPVTNPAPSPPAASVPDPQAVAAGSVDPAPGAASLVVDLQLTGESMLSVSVDAKPQVTRQYRSGEHVRYEAQEQILIDAGNAAAVSVTINGRPAKPLGAAGVHVRTRITRDNLAEFF